MIQNQQYNPIHGNNSDSQCRVCRLVILMYRLHSTVCHLSFSSNSTSTANKSVFAVLGVCITVHRGMYRCAGVCVAVQGYVSLCWGVSAVLGCLCCAVVYLLCWGIFTVLGYICCAGVSLSGRIGRWVSTAEAKFGEQTFKMQLNPFDPVNYHYTVVNVSRVKVNVAF